MINVPRQLPTRDRIVLLITRERSYCESGKTPALNEGQNIHKNTVPIMAKAVEM